MVLGLKEKIEQDYVSANEAAGMLGVTSLDRKSVV